MNTLERLQALKDELADLRTKELDQAAAAMQASEDAKLAGGDQELAIQGEFLERANKHIGRSQGMGKATELISRAMDQYVADTMEVQHDNA